MRGAAVAGPEETAVPGGFTDRRQAGRLLGGALAALGERQPLLVLGIPRGGVPVAYEVALALKAPLDVMVVRKLGYPGQPELALGAISSGGVLVLNPEVAAGVPQRVIEQIAGREQRELERREREYRGGRSAEDPAGRVVVVVDDGVATGASLKAALAALRQRRPARVIAAVPVSPVSTADEIRAQVDRFVCLVEAELFMAVGEWYVNFEATSDEEVEDLLARAAARDLESGAAGPRPL